MLTIITAYIMLAIASIATWLVLSKWSNSAAKSTKTKQLRKTGEDLMSENLKVTDEMAMQSFMKLINNQVIIVKYVESTDSIPNVFQQIPEPTRSVLTNYKRIEAPESDVEIAWSWVANRRNNWICVGRTHDIHCEILVETTSGKVQVGRDAFASLAHFLLFVAD